MSFIKKKILVTGAAGFLGSHLSEQLSNLGHDVVGIDSMIGGYEDNVPKNIKFIKMDCCDFENIKKIMKNINIVYMKNRNCYENFDMLTCNRRCINRASPAPIAMMPTVVTSKSRVTDFAASATPAASTTLQRTINIKQIQRAAFASTATCRQPPIWASTHAGITVSASRRSHRQMHPMPANSAIRSRP